MKLYHSVPVNFSLESWSGLESFALFYGFESRVSGGGSETIVSSVFPDHFYVSFADRAHRSVSSAFGLWRVASCDDIIY